MKFQRNGFTLVELLIVVAVVTVLSAVSVYSFHQYTKKAKASEATLKLGKISSGAMAWFSIEKLGKDGKVLPYHFPHKNSPALPGKQLSRSTAPKAALCSGAARNGRYPARKKQWQKSPWKQLKFSILHDHYYRYQYASAGAGSKATFEASARGDLDCNGVRSLYMVRHRVNGSGEVHREPMVVLKGLE